MNHSERLLEARPRISSTVDVIIPVYNEEGILRSQLEPVLAVLPPGFTVKVIENGSTDATLDILESMSVEQPQLEFVSLPHPNYGLAMKTGIAGSRTDIVIVDDLDVLDLDFWERGLKLLGTGEVDLVQGSKVLAGKDDRRPLVRRAATLTLTFLLRTLLGYRGTDTHGPKVVWREAISDIPRQCRLELDIFPTELVIRAQRAGVRIREIPIHLKEIRETPFPLYRRVPRALRDIWSLHRALKRGGRI